MYGGYSSAVERQIVALDAVGSNPTTHPIFPLFYLSLVRRTHNLRWGVAKW